MNMDVSELMRKKNLGYFHIFQTNRLGNEVFLCISYIFILFRNLYPECPIVPRSYHIYKKYLEFITKFHKVITFTIAESTKIIQKML